MRSFFALGLLVVAGCTASVPLIEAPPVTAEGLALSADRTTYARGAAVRLVLVNGAPTTATTGVLECAQFETWTGSAWVRSPVGNDRACIMIARVLAPGETMTGDITADVPAGSYRLTPSVSIDGADASVTVSTASFRVGG